MSFSKPTIYLQEIGHPCQDEYLLVGKMSRPQEETKITWSIMSDVRFELVAEIKFCPFCGQEMPTRLSEANLVL